MARNVLTPQKIVPGGLTLNLTAPNVDGDVVPTGPVALYVLNGSGASINVTAQTPQTVEGLAVAENIVAVPAGAFRIIGPFAAATYGRPAAPDKGQVYVDYSAQASVTRGLISF